MTCARLGVVGVGRWGKFIVRDLKSLGVEVWAAAPSGETRDNATAAGADRIVTCTEDLPTDLDGYVVATPEQTHLNVVEKLLPRGRPIFVEKPLDVDVRRAHTLPPAAHRLVFVMHKWRYHPGIVELGAISRSGELGPPHGLDLLRIQFDAPKRLVDTLWVLTPHDVSIALAILGEVPQFVGAWPHPLSEAGHGVVARLKTAAGIPILITNTIGAAETQRRITLGCRDGTACLADALDEHILIRRPNAPMEHRPIASGMPLLLELTAFVDHTLGGLPPMSSLEDELLMLDTIDAIHRKVRGDGRVFKQDVAAPV